MFYDCFYQWTVSSAIPAKEARLAAPTTVVPLVTPRIAVRFPLMVSASGSHGKVTARSVGHCRRMTTWWVELSTGEGEEVVEDEAEELEGAVRGEEVEVVEGMGGRVLLPGCHSAPGCTYILTQNPYIYQNPLLFQV